MIMVNLFGAPGSGKSTTAAGVFHELKKRKRNCEYLQEFAKQKTWEGNHFSLGVQPYITAKQLYLQDMLRPLDIVITDGSILNGLIYLCKYVNEHFEAWLLSAHRQFDNLNVFIRRDVDFHGYETAGRSQSNERAAELEKEIKAMLNRLCEPYMETVISPRTVDDILRWIDQKENPL